jgi:hypothetical protein
MVTPGMVPAPPRRRVQTPPARSYRIVEWLPRPANSVPARPAPSPLYSPLLVESTRPRPTRLSVPSGAPQSRGNRESRLDARHRR